MQEPKNTQLVPSNLSLESLKKLNEHGIEYCSARDLQPCLGYSQWRRFENAIKRAIQSCKQSGNDTQNHFAGAGKMVDIGSQTGRELDDYHLVFDQLAKRMHTSRAAVNRIPDPEKTCSLKSLAIAVSALGKQLEIRIA